jgi:hypothetical protein
MVGDGDMQAKAHLYYYYYYYYYYISKILLIKEKRIIKNKSIGKTPEPRPIQTSK